MLNLIKLFSNFLHLIPVSTSQYCYIVAYVRQIRLDDILYAGRWDKKMWPPTSWVMKSHNFVHQF